MCGIAGFYSTIGNAGHDQLIRAMTATLTHRGPDDEGYYVQGGAALGFRRLSIIDLKTGHQPMSNEDGTVWTVFNGEIYNFQELRRELIVKGHRFVTASDTEVIVHLYEEEGENLFTRLDGMFAAAIWDTLRRKLILARDPMGKKPLHYARTADGIVFGSEIKALLKHPSVSKAIDTAALATYMQTEWIPAPDTIYSQIRKLPPASMLVYANGECSVTPYWQMPYDAPKYDLSESEAADTVRDLLQGAVRKRLISDVPLGVFLSGGIDSSSVAAMMVRCGGKVQSFSIGFDDPEYDESPYASSVARHLGTDHQVHRFNEQTLLASLEEAVSVSDEPFADPSIVPTYILSRFTRTKVTVALGGDGGDEIFAGYPTYRAHQLHGWYRAIPSAGRSLLSRAVSHMRVGTGYFTADFKARRFMRGAGFDLPERHARWMSAFLPEELGGLMKLPADDTDRLASLYRNAMNLRFADPREAPLYLDARHYLADDVLVKVDRASMAVSLEVRAPLLDKVLVEFVCRLPYRMKLKGSCGKYLLKQALRGILPDEIITRRKQGFALPLSRWFRKELKPLTERYLNPARLAAENFFDPEAVSRLCAEHADGKADHRKSLWTLLSFQIWKEKHG